MGEHGIGVVLADDAPVEQFDARTGAGGQLAVVGDIHNGFAALRQAGEQIKDRVRCVRVEIASWLVGDEHGRIIRQGAGDGDRFRAR